MKGENFVAGTWVELRSMKGTVLADTVRILSSTSLLASILVPKALEGTFDLVITGASGEEQVLPSGVSASVYRFRAFAAATGVELKPYPRDQPSAQAARSAATSFPCQGIEHCDGEGFVSILPGCEGKLIHRYTGRSGFYYRIFYNGLPRRCWAKLHVRPKTVDGLGVTPDPTGGHCHSDANRPVGAPVDTAGYTTDGSSDEFAVVHRWPEAAGQLESVLWTTDPNCPDDADSTTADFLYCIYSPAIYESWVEARPPGPGDRTIGTTPQHPAGVTQAMVLSMATALDSVSADWHRWYPNGPQLGFNDASLPWGGVFDVDPVGSYTPEHCGHRVGTEMDIISKHQAPLTPDQLSDAEFLFDKWKFYWAPEGDHIHVYYYGLGAYMDADTGSPIPDEINRRRRGK